MTYAAAIKELYGDSFLRKSVLSIRDGAGVFEKVLGGKGYKTIVEIGTYRGVSAAELSRYCDHVITIDLDFGKLEQNGGYFDRYELWNNLGIKNIDLCLVRNDAEKASIIDSLTFDFAFIDGAHDETVKNDFKLVKRCGNVLFHDADDNRLRDKNPQAPNHVNDFIRSLPESEVEFIDIFALWRQAS